MTITFIGHGYVGLVTAAVFADLGNTVHVIGHTKEKIENLKKGILPIYEPGLEELVKRNIEAKRLTFTLDYTPAISESDIVFIAVGTPSTPTGEADMSTVLEVAKKVGQNLSGYTVVVTKSTVPVGSNKEIKRFIEEEKDQKAELDIASVPEFLREGTAIQDTLNPDRVVIGAENERSSNILVELHKGIESPVLLTNIETAELIKYASNSYLATKISFANAIAQLSELVGADALHVLKGVGMDERIGSRFLQPGAGYGGSCFPKDVKALIATSKKWGYDFQLLEEVENINQEARMSIVKKAKKLLEKVDKKTVAILGLAFKPDTDDMRYAPSITVIEELSKMGAHIKAYDPIAQKNAKRAITAQIEYLNDPYKAVEDADLLIIMTEWNEFKEMDLVKIKKLMKEAKLLDARNIFEPETAKNNGFIYMGVGRK